MPEIPPQRHRCPTYAWCRERAPGHRLHVGEACVLSTSRGTEIRVSLTAGADREPALLVEGTFDDGGPMMELTELDAREATELAEVLLRLAQAAQGSRKEVR